MVALRRQRSIDPAPSDAEGKHTMTQTTGLGPMAAGVRAATLPVGSIDGVATGLRPAALDTGTES